jgi:hypothetical protein
MCISDFIGNKFATSQEGVILFIHHLVYKACSNETPSIALLANMADQMGSSEKLSHIIFMESQLLYTEEN